MSQTAPAPRDVDGRGRMTLSAVVRVSGREGAAALDETFFSLAIQDWRDCEVVVALAAGGAAGAAGEGLARRVAEAVEAQPWPGAPRYKVVRAEGGGGGAVRGATLGRAVGEASGRFLTLLDAGVVAYQHGYAELIRRLVETGRGVAAGGCRSAHVRGEAGRGYVVTKDDFALDGSPLGLLRRKSAPLCAHVIDRARVADSALTFADGDGGRDFLARLYAACEPDLSTRGVFVCERRLRAGGAEGILYAAARGGYRLRERLRPSKR